MDLIIFFLIGHYVGDYGLQSDRMAAMKKSSAATLTLHVFTYTITIALAFTLFWILEGLDNSPSLIMLASLAIILFVTHWAQDYVKSRISGPTQLYYVDQSLHIFLLVIFRYILVG
ncbi:MAG: DUF3307 domain-containing protein [candidate division Zixibacteria bacterium]|nr:DUF3307 domain-containing protein [candidate division Zixibacteria bacterium]